MPTLFNSCTNLEYINIYNFNEYELNDITGMFNNVPENIVICLNENTTCKYILPKIRKKKCYIIDCSNDWKSKQKKIINNNNKCSDFCNQDAPYEYNGKCYENCLNGVLYDDSYNISNKCKCEIDKCLTCPIVALYYNLCEKCNINYYPKENDPSNLGDYINCYNQSEEGYYLDYNYSLYKKCYHTCKICNISGNNLTHNCLECKDNFQFKQKLNNYFNCYENNSIYHQNFENISYFTMNLSYQTEYVNSIENITYYNTILSENINESPKFSENLTESPKFSENIIEYTKFSENITDYIISSENMTVYPKLSEKITESLVYETENIDKNLHDEKNQTKDNEIEYYDNILKKNEDEFTSENYNTTDIENGQDNIIINNKIITTLTTSENQKNNTNNNMTRIDLGECEILLRNYYNISINEKLYIKKIDVIQEGMKTLKVEYDVYAKLSKKKFNKIKFNSM